MFGGEWFRGVLEHPGRGIGAFHKGLEEGGEPTSRKDG
jgi:hypothetical protein